MNETGSQEPASDLDRQTELPTPAPEATLATGLPATKDLPPDSDAPIVQPTIPGYEILAVLGQGGMGVVYKARQLSLDRVVAVKVIRPESLAHDDAVRRFRREAQSAAKLSHPHIVTVYDAGQVGKQHYCVMEYVEGVDLQRLVDRGKPLAVATACAYVRQAALGLQHAHERSLVHRDIKPANLIVSNPSASDGGSVKLLDLGLARLSQSDAEGGLATSLTEPGLFLGTVDYVAPEQAVNSRNADIRSDLYSLGCTFFFMLTGRPPFPGETLLEKLDKHRFEPPPSIERLRADLPSGVADVIRKLLAKKPADRFQTPADLAAAVEAVHRRSGVLASPLAKQTAAQSTVKVPAVCVVPTFRETACMTGHTATVWSVTFASNGRRILSSSDDKSVRLWDTDTGREVRRFGGLSPTVMYKSLVMSVDNQRILAGGDDRSVRVWNAENGTELRRLLGHVGPIKSVALSPTGRRALTGGDRTVRVWDLDTGKELYRLSGHKEDVASVAFSPDNRHLVSASWDKTIRLWDLQTGREVRRLGERTDRQLWIGMSVAFFPDGKMIACGSSDHAIYLWDVESGHELARFDGHGDAVSSIAFAPDGHRLLSGSWDKTVRIWDTETQRELARGIGHTDRVQSVAFGPDGRAGVSGGDDKTVRMWRLPG
jgi:serine/threonine protein kinase